MSFKLDYVDTLAKRNKANSLGVVVSLSNNQVDCDEGIEVNAATVLPTSKKVDDRTKQPVVPSIGIQASEQFKARTISANFEPANIPVKNWIIHKYILGYYITLIVAAGAVGKSMFTLTQAISVAIGKDLLKLGKVKQGNALVINNEDDDNELDRRVAGVCEQYGIECEELTDKLFIKSGYGERVYIAEGVDRIIVMSPNVKKIISFITTHDIKLLVIDPFVSTHQASENDNSAIDQVMSYYREIASETGVAIVSVHHTRKDSDASDAHAGDVDIARGASSLKDAARLCFTLAPMSQKYANDNNIDNFLQKRLARLDDAKNNFTLSDGIPKWFLMESVKIANGEWLGVPRPYELDTHKPNELELAEKAKSKTIHTIGLAALHKLGEEGGTISSPDLLAEYMNISGYKRSQAKDNISLLPLGSLRKELIKPNGKTYRIFQTKEDKKTATRYVHIEPDD